MEPTSSITQEASAEAAADAGTVSIELDFKAFADHVPPTEHAKRAPGYGDPSLQDFADQALELAALRAELNRLARDHEILRQQALAREARLDALRAELTATRSQLREALRQSRDKGSVQEATLALETPLAVPQLVSLDHPGRTTVLTRDIVTIGRTRNNDICLPSTGVSRDHARLLVAPGSVTLVDASSTNGCFINDVRVTRQRLRDGDLVRIGDRS
ncbi:MAG TPA: FHA domain-containing protein, partial [Steroidobacteraceae bacterium]|nr:FHA domain-containing protein [Steroidobacteraceae bacterium]